MLHFIHVELSVITQTVCVAANAEHPPIALFPSVFFLFIAKKGAQRNECRHVGSEKHTRKRIINCKCIPPNGIGISKQRRLMNSPFIRQIECFAIFVFVCM